MPEKSSIIYDDSCRLCNNAVRFLKTKKGSGGMVFLPAEGKDTDQLLTRFQIPREMTDKTVIFIDDERAYIKSAAIIKALQKKGGWWILAGIFRIFPVSVRDGIYDRIASRRKK